jgi:PleD family two-component response regulator
MVTLSMGIAEFDYTLETEKVVKSADEALYRAKNTGGNQIYFAEKKVI